MRLSAVMFRDTGAIAGSGAPGPGPKSSGTQIPPFTNQE